MKQFIQQFLDHLQVRNYSARTIADYGYHLNLWLQFLREHKIADLPRIVDSTLAEFQRWLYYQPTRLGTARGVLNQNAVMAALKSFFRFLKSEGLVLHDPAAALEYARQPKCRAPELNGSGFSESAMNWRVWPRVVVEAAGSGIDTGLPALDPGWSGSPPATERPLARHDQGV